MKPIKFNEDARIKIFEKFVQKFKKELDNFENNINDTKLSFSAELSTVAKEKVRIIFDANAYVKMRALVQHYTTEVSWYGLVKKLDRRKYYVYDVKIYKQYVSGAKVDTEDEDMLAFYDSLTDEEFNDLHFQAHSHVNMGTGASTIDLQNQADIVKNMGKEGFMIFQIWNKSDDINTYLYDISGNVFYDRKDIEIEFACGDELVSDFVKASAELISEKKWYPYQNGEYSGYSKYQNYSNYNGKKKEDEKEPAYLPNYYGYGDEGWDYD